jgi:hypothetical protein
MDVYIYTEGTRKVRGEEQQFLAPVAVLEDFDSVDAALEALVDEYPDFMGTEFVIFTCAPDYVTVEEPTAKYSFSRRGDNEEDTGEEEAEEEEYEEEEPEADEGEEEEYEDEGEEEEAEEEEPPPPPARKKKPAAKKKPLWRSREEM